MNIEPTALVVEDDIALTTICERALTTSGFKTTVVSTGEAALEQIDTLRPDLIILDLHLPKISGEAILNHIRINDQLKKTRVIIVSADAVLAQFLEHKADFVLTKPVSYQQLRRISSRLNPSPAN